LVFLILLVIPQRVVDLKP